MRNNLRIALFGESEKGDYRTPYFCDTLPQLADYFGNPPEESHGLHLAVQSLLYNHYLIYFRVKEEGFSNADYFQGIQLLNNQNLMPFVCAICIPGVADLEIVDAMTQLCLRHSNILIMNEADLFDYLSTR